MAVKTSYFVFYYLCKPHGGLQECLFLIWLVCNRTCMFNHCSEWDIA